MRAEMDEIKCDKIVPGNSFFTFKVQINSHINIDSRL